MIGYLSNLCGSDLSKGRACVNWCGYVKKGVQTTGADVHVLKYMFV